MSKSYHPYFGWIVDRGVTHCCRSCLTEAEDVFDLDEDGHCEQCAEDLEESEAYVSEVREQYRFGQSGR